MASSSRISQASCPQRPWALDADTRPDLRVATIRDPEGIWTALGVCVCVCVVHSFRQLLSLYRFGQWCSLNECVRACMVNSFRGLTADPVEMGGVERGGGGAEGSCVLLEHLPLFLLSQALVRRGKEGSATGEAIEEKKEESG